MFPNFLVTNQSASAKSIAKYAGRVLQECKNESWKPGCYDREIPKLMDDDLSMEDAFKVVQKVQEQDKQYLYCHVVAHKLSYKEAEKHPDAWKDVITRVPNNICNNGGLHGAVMQRFKDEVLTDQQVEEFKPDAKNLCEPRGKWKPVEVEKSMCYHGLGHLFMFITDADIPKSLSLCEYAGVKPDGRNYLQTCSQGVFMILYQPLEPEDFALVEGIAPTNTQERNNLCSKFSNLYWESCMSESWPLYRDRMVNYNDPDNLVNVSVFNEFCSYAANSIARQKCYETGLSMIAVVVMINYDDQAQYERICKALPGDVVGRCFAFGILRLLQIDPKFSSDALGLCKAAASHGYEQECYGELVYQGKRVFHPASQEHKNYCDKLPETWKQSCLKEN